MTPAKIGILGGAGRMGQMIAREIATGAWPCTVGASVEIKDNSAAAFESCDLLIDFTSPAATSTHARLAVQHKKPLVVGTTGLGTAEEEELAKAARYTPILVSANMSVGINLLSALIEQAAARLGADFDIEIFEAHHRNKVDAPSGTALLLGQSAARGRGVLLKDVISTARQGVRKPGDIGFSVFRGGDVVGEHTVTFAGAGERVELVHKAADRAIFARGALRAALWLQGQPAGLYTMQDMLRPA